MEYIDIGVNLLDKRFEGKQDVIMENSAKAGVTIIITGCSMKDSQKASKYVTDHNGIYSTAGVHPHNARFWSDKDAQCLMELIQRNSKIVAVGECGLDYDRMFSPMDMQQLCFEQQIEVAEIIGKPLFLHERKAETDFYKILKRHTKAAERSVVHCFTGTKETVMKYIELGCKIGITGWICDDARNKNLLEAIRVIPLEKIMIETDSPYLTPKNITGSKRINYPWYIHYVCNRIAKEKDIPEDVVKKAVLENTLLFFDIESQPV